MMNDEIIQEVWQSKDAIAAKYGHNLVALAKALRERERRSKAKVVDLRHEGPLRDLKAQALLPQAGALELRPEQVRLGALADLVAMAADCLTLLTDCAGAKRFSLAARARASALFDYRVIIPQYERLYERVLGTPR